MAVKGLGVRLKRLSLIAFFVPLFAWSQQGPQLRMAQVQSNRPSSSPGASRAQAPVLIGVSTLPDDDREAVWDKKNLKATWRLALSGSRREDSLANRRTGSSFAAILNSTYDLTSFVNLTVNPRAYFQNGHVQADSAKNGKSNALELSEASANLHWDEALQFSVGALNQTRDLSGLVVDDLAFPAARLTLQAGATTESYAALVGQTAVPTSSSLTTNSRDFEKTPSFTSGGVKSQAKLGAFTLKARAMYFEFRDLPTGIATDAAVLGNTTVQGPAAGISEFAYDYRGTEGGLGARLDFNKSFGLEIDASGIKNDGAPSELSQGYTVFTKADLWVGSVKWSPSFEYFNVQPDASVAYYSSSSYQTNRVGYETGLALQYKKIFRLSLSGGERDVLFETPSQSRERFFSLSMETVDAPL